MTDYYYQWGDPEKSCLRRSDASIGKTTDTSNRRVLFIPVDEGNTDTKSILNGWLREIQPTMLTK